MKKCTKCHKLKSLLCFHISKIFKDNHNDWCKHCMKLYIKKHNQQSEVKHANYLRSKKYASNNRIKRRLSCKKWRERNIEHVREYGRIYNQKKKSNVKFRILKSLRSRVRMALKKNIKSLSTLFLIGCEVDFLMYYIQCKFKNGMNWDNYGRGDNGKGMKEWHIDHIRPCSSFDLSKPEEQRKCFHYTNLQPLWAKENQEKGNKQNKENYVKVILD